MKVEGTRKREFMVSAMEVKADGATYWQTSQQESMRSMGNTSRFVLL
jgi:hypothetical protein